MFAYSGTVVPAVAALAGGYVASRQKRSVILGSLVGGGAVAAALVVMALIASACFPHYPRLPVNESLALLLTCPCVVAGVLSFRYLGGWSDPSRASRAVLPVLLCAVWLAGIPWTYSLTTWSYRKALPWSATDISEHAWTEGFLPDYSYWMRAKISETQFEAYVAKYALQQSKDDSYSWQSDEHKPSWFKSQSIEDKLFKAEDGRWFMCAFYDSGFIYVTAMLQ